MRRRLAAKKRKLKVAGKSKSTDTEDESTFDYCDDDGKIINQIYALLIRLSLLIRWNSIASEFSRRKREREGNFWMAEKRIRFRIRRVVKAQWFYWFVIVLVFLNTATMALGHHGQPNWLKSFLCKLNGIHWKFSNRCLNLRFQFYWSISSKQFTASTYS